MSDEKDKIKHSKRLQNDQNAINKQLKIAKQHGYTLHDEVIRQSHRLVKHHVMDCGTPGCSMCGNRRHSKATKEKLTAQEQRIFQDIDTPNDRHSNGLKNEQEANLL